MESTRQEKCREKYNENGKGHVWRKPEFCKDKMGKIRMDGCTRRDMKTQGSALFSFQFLIAMDILQKDVKLRIRRNTGSILIADDLVMGRGDDDEIQQSLDLWNKEIKKRGMDLSDDKSKVLVQDRDRDV